MSETKNHCPRAFMGLKSIQHEHGHIKEIANSKSEYHNYKHSESITDIISREERSAPTIHKNTLSSPSSREFVESYNSSLKDLVFTWPEEPRGPKSAYALQQRIRFHQHTRNTLEKSVPSHFRTMSGQSVSFEENWIEPVFHNPLKPRFEGPSSKKKDTPIEIAEKLQTKSLSVNSQNGSLTSSRAGFGQNKYQQYRQEIDRSKRFSFKSASPRSIQTYILNHNKEMQSFGKEKLNSNSECLQDEQKSNHVEGNDSNLTNDTKLDTNNEKIEPQNSNAPPIPEFDEISLKSNTSSKSNRLSITSSASSLASKQNSPKSSYLTSNSNSRIPQLQKISPTRIENIEANSQKSPQSISEKQRSRPSTSSSSYSNKKRNFFTNPLSTDSDVSRAKLKLRQSLPIRERFTQPVTSSHEYGWSLSQDINNQPTNQITFGKKVPDKTSHFYISTF